jgi:hypothetical protein
VGYICAVTDDAGVIGVFCHAWCIS